MSLERNKVSLFFRYARNLPVSRQSLQIKCKLCQLIDVVRILATSEINLCANKWMEADDKLTFNLLLRNA